MAERTMKALLRGRLTGVGFRSFIQRRATELDLRGYVQALPDHTLVVVAAGPRSRLEEFVDYLESGGDKADIEDTTVTWDTVDVSESRFTIRHGL